MGSLMAGWDSPVLSSSKGFERKRSLTRTEIDMFWKSKREREEQHLKEAMEASKQLKKQGEEKSHELCEGEAIQQELERSLEKMANSCDWWTKSSWAFLNDPQLKTIEVLEKCNESKK